MDIGTWGGRSWEQRLQQSDKSSKRMKSHWSNPVKRARHIEAIKKGQEQAKIENAKRVDETRRSG